MSEPRKSPAFPLAIAVLAAVALLGTLLGTVVSSGSGDEDRTESTSSSAAANPPPDDSWRQLVRGEADDPMAMGELEAPVVMIIYSDFQCPFCGKFGRDTMPIIIDRYVEDGTLRLEWRDFPYLGDESVNAAAGARSAAAQDSFWAFHDELYADQLPPNSGDLDEAYLRGIAEKLGLDVERFSTDMKSDATREAVSKDFSEGQAIGVTGTPTFVINGVPVIGAQPVEVFEKTIEEAAARAGS